MHNECWRLIVPHLYLRIGIDGGNLLFAGHGKRFVGFRVGVGGDRGELGFGRETID